MSFVTDARAYFDARIKEIDPDLNIIDDALDDEPINNVEAVKGYKMVFGEISPDRDGSTYIENIPVTIKIYDQPYRCEIETFDTLYCKAQDIKDKVIAPKLAKNQPNWSDIFAVSLVPSQEESDDKLFNMTIEFNIRRDLYFN